MSNNYLETIEKMGSIIASQKSIIRQLKRRIKLLEMRAKVRAKEIVTEVNLCKSCYKGRISKIDFKYVTLYKCNHCSYEKRERIKRRNA